MYVRKRTMHAGGLVAIASCLLAAPVLAASSPVQPSAQDRLAKATPYLMKSLLQKIRNHRVDIHWIGDTDRFWYRDETADGVRYLIVDAASGAKQPAFDAKAMAASLSAALKRPVSENALPISALRPTEQASVFDVTVGGARLTCDLAQSDCRPNGKNEDRDDLVPAPDGKRVVFRRDNNLWLRDLDGGKERQLTSDGILNFGYGDVDGYTNEMKVPLRRAGVPEPLRGVHWSPDGRHVLALRQDLRAIPERLVLTENLPPEGGYPVNYIKHVAVPADPKRADSFLSIADVETGAVRKVALDPQALNDWSLPYLIANGFIAWTKDSQSVFIIGASRGGDEYKLIRIDIATGETRDVVTEHGRFNVRMNPRDDARPNVYVFADGRQAIWYSERDGWGHLYLYDVATGKPIRQITEGAWVVADIVRVDEEKRQIYFVATGREQGRNPYFRHLYRVGIDGGTPELLTPENADHEFNFWRPFYFGPGSGSTFSPSGKYLVDSFSTATEPATVVIRKQSGELVGEVARADISALRAMGWRPPEQFVVKAADGTTDLYGVIYKPSDFDPRKKYPIIEETYPGPQGKYAPATFRGYFNVLNPQAFAELGFLVVYLDGRGTAYRSREFRDAFLGTNDPFGSADHAAALRNLAKTRSYMDLSRVGVTGYSFGGYGSLRAMLLHPDLYKVCVSGVGPGDWIEFPGDIQVDRFFGVPGRSDEARKHYDDISNTRMADKLTGKLLLIYGGIDEVVPLQAGFRLIDALIRADKPFDTLIVPNSGHQVPVEPYAQKRTMLYFMEHLGDPK